MRDLMKYIKPIIFVLIVAMALSVSAIPGKRVIGVTAFTNLSKDKNFDWLCIGIADTISYKLRNVQEYILVDRVNVDKIIGELQLSQSGLIDENTVEAGKALGANILVVGNFQKFGNQIRITAKIVDVQSHTVINQVQVTGSLNDIFNLQDSIALGIIEKNDTTISTETKTKIVQNDTNNISAYEYFVRGQKFLLYQLDYEKAIEMYQKAISIDPNYAIAYAGLGKAYSLRSWALREYQNITDPTLVEKSFQSSKKALSLNPNLDEAHLSLARYYQEVDEKKVPNKWALCEQETRKALEINENNAEAYLLLSKIYAYDIPKSEMYLKQAIEKNKFLVDAQNNLGIIYLNRGDLDTAYTYIKNAIDIDENYVIGYMNLGVIYEKRGQYDKALEMYKMAVSKYPNYILGLRNLGIGYRNLNRLDEALETFFKALKIKKDDAQTLSEIGYVYLLKADYNKAIDYFKQSLKFDPSYRYSLANLGWCLVQQGKYSEAIPYLEKAHNDNQDYAWSAGYLGWLYENKFQDANKALYWYGEALKRDPNNQDYRNAYNRLSGYYR